MNNWILTGLLFFSILSIVNSQVYFSRDGKISFYSEAPLEKIEAHNHNASSVISLEDGRIEFAVLIKAFQFKKALMQEHFNENYLQSDLYPKATFKGSFDGFKSEDMSNEKEFHVNINGVLTIHGQSKQIDVKGTITPNGENISAKSSFQVLVQDFDIKIPKIVRDKIAKEVSVEVKIDYIPMKSE